MNVLNELVFNISDSKASAIRPVSIESLGFKERSQLQKWVIEHPEILGDDILIIGSEFDQWLSSTGINPRDRLDILGLGNDGRLVLAELKRGRAPDTVHLQAIKYAAMVSRFTQDTIANLYAEFLHKIYSYDLSAEEALEKLHVHTNSQLLIDLLLRPRIVLLAEDFSPTVLSSAVWLNEQGVDMSLRRYQAYETRSEEIILIVSQLYPFAEISEFEVIPRLRSSAQRRGEVLPEKAWNVDDLRQLVSLSLDVPNAILDLCSRVPGEWIGVGEVYEHAELDKGSGTALLANFTTIVRRQFTRNNPPWESERGSGGQNQRYFMVTLEMADLWKEIRSTPTVKIDES